MAKLTHMAEELRRIAGELEQWCGEAAQMQDVAEERDTIPAPPVRMTHTRFAAAFKARYEAARQMEWYLPRNTQDCMDLAQWVDGQALRDKRDPVAVGKQLLDNFFTNPAVREAGYPISWLAKDPGRHYRPASEDGKPDPQETEKRRRAAESRYHEAKRRAEEEHMKGVRARAAQKGE